MNLGSDEQRQKKGIAIFASGTGTNAENCIRYFHDHPQAEIRLIVSNKKEAGVLEIAQRYHIPSLVFLKSDWQQPEIIVRQLRDHHIDLIVLAGFLALVPPLIIRTYPHRIINIHPALLPKFGGKGMFGQHVHQAVIDAAARETGITIHEVDEEYDHGKVLFQEVVPVLEEDDAASLEKKVRALEYQHLPRVVEKLLLNM